MFTWCLMNQITRIVYSNSFFLKIDKACFIILKVCYIKGFFLRKILWTWFCEDVMNLCWEDFVDHEFNKAWTQVLRRIKSCSWRVGDSRWWRSLTMVPAGNKAKCLSSVNHTTKIIHRHHHQAKLEHTGFSLCLWNRRYIRVS